MKIIKMNLGKVKKSLFIKSVVICISLFLLTKNGNTQTVGNTNVMGTKTTSALRVAQPANITEDGAIISITIYHDAGNGNMVLAIYSDDNGVPDQLITQAQATVAATQGWQTVELPSPLNVSTGEVIWLAWGFDANPGTYYGPGTPGRAYSNDSWSGTMPATFGPCTINDYIYSVYATYVTAGSESAWFQNGDDIFYNGRNVGIGNASPNTRLHLKGTTFEESTISLERNNNGEGSGIRFIGRGAAAVNSGVTLGGLYFWSSESPTSIAPGAKIQVMTTESWSTSAHGTSIGFFTTPNESSSYGTDPKMLIDNSGYVGIGTTNPTSTLTVNGDIKAKKVQIVNDVPASDFVFENDYRLKSLEELELYIHKNKHLPEVPSTDEFRGNGYSVGEMDDILLRKVEELTLYIIEQNRLLKEQSEKITQLEKENAEIKEVLENSK